MALGRPFLAVPLLSQYVVKLAELSAIDLWNAIDYETGEAMEASDEELLVNFHLPILHMARSSTHTNLITEIKIRQLIRLGKLKALYRSHLPLDFNKGIRATKKDVVSTYVGWKSKELKLTPTGYATKMTLNLGASFVKTTKEPSRNGNYRVPLASRLLFYAVPDMLVFNYSNGLGKALNLQSRPQNAIAYFNERMNAGLERNKKLLNKLKMPQPIIIETQVWKNIQSNGWWQRRVLDLALLIHFRLAVPRIELQRKARLAIRKKTKPKII